MLSISQGGQYQHQRASHTCYYKVISIPALALWTLSIVWILACLNPEEQRMYLYQRRLMGIL